MAKVSLQERLARNLKAYRKLGCWSQQAMADRAQIHLRHYQKIEAGEVNVTLETLEKLERAFRLPATLLFE